MAEGDLHQASCLQANLPVELAEMRSLFHARHADALLEDTEVPTPPMPMLVTEDDVLSLAASASHFRDNGRDRPSQASEPGSHSSGQSSLSELGDSSMQAIIPMVLDRLQLEIPQKAESAPESTFFRSRSAPTAFAVLPSKEYLRELHACWRETGSHSHLSANAWS